MPIDIDKLLADAQLPKRIVSVCTRGDLTAEAQRLEDQLREADAKPTTGRLVPGKTSQVTLATELDALREQMREASIEFELTAFPTARWRALKSEHPVGDSPSQADAVIGADTTSLFNASVPLSITSPELTDAQWDRLLEVMPTGEWNKLVDAVYALNEEGTQLPFSSRAYAILRAQSDESESLEASA